MDISNPQLLDDMAAAGWMRTGEAARKLGISPQRLFVLVRDGRVPFRTTPYGRMFPPSVSIAPPRSKSHT